MNNVIPSGPNDEISGLEGDTMFVGVDERTPAQQLPVGFVASATNKRFRRGRAETRKGVGILPWGLGTGTTPFTAPLGAFLFQDPNQGGEWWIIAANGKVYCTRNNGIAREVPLPAGVVLTADTFRKFVQANGSILLLRGLNNDTLACEDLEAGFHAIAQENIWTVALDAATNRVEFANHNLLVGDPVQFSGVGLPAAVTAQKTFYVLTTPDADHFTIAAAAGGAQATWNTSDTDATVSAGFITVLDGAEPIAPAEDGFFMFNRLYLIVSKDEVAQSDIGDFTRYQRIPNTFRINQGDSYTLVSVYPFNEDTILFFKSGNVKKAVGVSDLSTAQGPLNVTEAYGSASPSNADQGTDVFWLNSELRVTSLNLTQLNQTQATSFALSDRLVQTFERINPLYARKARLAIHDGYLRVALPLDDATVYDAAGAAVATGVNNAIAVYDFQARFQDPDTGLSGAWAGVDSSPATGVLDWVKFTLWGKQRLGFLGADGYLHVCDDDYEDEAAQAITPYTDLLVDGYTGTNLGAEVTVNGVGQLAADTTSALNAAGGHWGVKAPADLAQNLWHDPNNTGGFDPASANHATPPNCTVTQIPGGVRFTSTNGTLPVVTITGAAAAALSVIIDAHDTPAILGLPIADAVRTRAYLCRRQDFKRFTVLAANIATWAPDYTISTATQGVNTDTAYRADVTRDRTKYFQPFDKPDYDPSNSNDDFNAPSREDYSVVLPDLGAKVDGAGIAPDLMQEAIERAVVNERGLWVQLVIANAQGRLELIATAMESQAGEVLSGVAIS